MTVSCLAGAFNTGVGGIGTTIDVTGSIAISGASAVILFFNGRVDTVDAAGRATRWRGMGFAVGATDRRCQVSQDADAQTAHTGGSYHSNAACIASVAVGTATDGLMDFDSWLSNGFRLIVDDVMPRSYRVGYLIITGLTNAATGQWQDSGTTGDKVITTALSFQPDCEILLSTTIDTTPPGGRAGNEMMGMGWAVSTTKLAAWAGGADEGSATTDTDSYANDVECLASETAAAGTTLATRFTFVSHNSNGFTLNQAIVPATICYNHFLALKGGSYDVQSVATRTDGADINTGALGFTPAGLLILSAFKTEHAAGTMSVHDTWSMGAASDATTRFACSVYSQDGVADTVVYTAIEHDAVYIATTISAVEGLMDIKTWADPITFVMDDADPSAKFVTMLVIGNAGGGTQYNQSATGGITPAGTLVRQGQRGLAGTLASGGGLVKQAQRALTAAIASVGVVIKQTQRALTGTAASSGVAAGVKITILALTGTLASAGALTRQAQKGLVGAMASAGGVGKQTARALTGGMASSGTLAVSRLFARLLTGTLASAGGLVKQTQKGLVGAMASAGGVGKQISRALGGVLNWVGGLIGEWMASLTAQVKLTVRVRDVSLGVSVRDTAIAVAVRGVRLTIPEER